MKTIDEFRSGLNFRNIAGNSRSFQDLEALRDLLKEKAWDESATMGIAIMCLREAGKHGSADALEGLQSWLVGLIEADIMAIDAFLRGRKNP